jgi:hypothetical protein
MSAAARNRRINNNDNNINNFQQQQQQQPNYQNQLQQRPPTQPAAPPGGFTLEQMLDIYGKRILALEQQVKTLQSVPIPQQSSAAPVDIPSNINDVLDDLNDKVSYVTRDLSDLKTSVVNVQNLIIHDKLLPTLSSQVNSVASQPNFSQPSFSQPNFSQPSYSSNVGSSLYSQTTTYAPFVDAEENKNTVS